YTAVASTNFERRRPTRNSVRVVAALASRGQIDITLTKGTNEVMVRIRAERTTSSRWTMTVRQLSESAVTISPKVLTWAGCRCMSCGVARRDMMEKLVGQLVEVRRPRGRQ